MEGVTDFESNTCADAVKAKIYVVKKKITLDIIERMLYNEKQKMPEVLSTKAQDILDQLNIEFIDSERARGYF